MRRRFVAINRLVFSGCMGSGLWDGGGVFMDKYSVIGYGTCTVGYMVHVLVQNSIWYWTCIEHGMGYRIRYWWIQLTRFGYFRYCHVGY
jgi:hypothetical protein